MCENINRGTKANTTPTILSQVTWVQFQRCYIFIFQYKGLVQRVLSLSKFIMSGDGFKQNEFWSNSWNENVNVFWKHLFPNFLCLDITVIHYRTNWQHQSPQPNRDICASLCLGPRWRLLISVLMLRVKWPRWRHKWKHFPRYWLFVRGIHRSPVNSPHKGQWCWALMFSLICARINGWVNNREAGDLRCHRAHYDVIVMFRLLFDSTVLRSVSIIWYQSKI